MATAKIIERLRKGRTELSQRELAAKLDMSLSSYQRMIDGTNPLTLDIIQRAAKFFKVSDEMIMGKVPLYDEPKVVEPVKEEKLSPVTVSIIVQLDGLQSTLEQWVSTLHKINSAI